MHTSVSISVPHAIAYVLRDEIASVRHYVLRAGLRPTEQAALQRLITSTLTEVLPDTQASALAATITRAIVAREPIRIIGA